MNKNNTNGFKPTSWNNNKPIVANVNNVQLPASDGPMVHTSPEDNNNEDNHNDNNNVIHVNNMNTSSV